MIAELLVLDNSGVSSQMLVITACLCYNSLPPFTEMSTIRHSVIKNHIPAKTDDMDTAMMMTAK